MHEGVLSGVEWICFSSLHVYSSTYEHSSRKLAAVVMQVKWSIGCFYIGKVLVLKE